MNTTKKIIAFDLDGTLSVSKRPMEESMAKLIEELAKKKIVVVISGGSFSQFQSQFLPHFLKSEDFNSFIKNLIILPTSGSQRFEYDLEKNNWVMTDMEPLSKNVKERATELLKDMIDRGEYGIPKVSKGEHIEDRLTQLSISALGQEAPIEEKQLWDPDQSKRQKIKAYLDPLLPELNIVIGGTTTIDMLTKGFDKGVGLLRLVKRLGLNKEDMLFVGDAIFPGGNDYAPFLVGIECEKTTGPEETAEIIKKFI